MRQTIASSQRHSLGKMKKTGLLIHIGYHKTSSTWLQKCLFRNSDLKFILPWKPLEILPILTFPHPLDFTPHTCKAYFWPAIHKAQNCGLVPVVSCEELSGNPHSGGYASKELADRLVKIFPTAKILIVIREQKSMITSTYKQYVKIGGTHPLVNYLQPPTCGKQRIPLFDWNHFKYHRLIQYYINLFGHSQLLVLPYEFFQDSPVEFILQIIQFCGLDVKTEVVESLPYAIKKNESLSGISITLKRHVNRIIGHRDRLNQEALIPVALSTSCQKLNSYWQKLDSLIPSVFKEASDRRFKKCVCRLIGERYKQSNTLVSEMLNLNLSQYGYDLSRFL